MTMHRSRPLRTALALAFLLAGFLCRAGAAATSMVPDEVIIKFKPGASASDVRAVLDDLGATRVKRFGRIQAEEHRIARRSVLDAVRRYEHHPAIQFIEPNWMFHADVVPNDPLFPQQWALLNTGQTGGTPGADIHATSAWDAQTGSADIVVAIVDTGTDYTHPDLAPNIWTNVHEIPGNGVDDDGNGLVDDVHGYDFLNSDPDPMDDSGHGTHVSGTVGAVGNNGIGVAGVAWNVKIMPLKFLDASGSGPASAAVECIEYAIQNGARILNLSWGGTDFSAALQLAIEDANAAGVVCVAAAGNSSVSLDQVPHFPASLAVPNVIAVASSTDRDELSAFSNFGRGTVPIAAPGSNIWSTFLGGDYQSISGTSMATPHVSGALALLWSKFPRMPIAQLKTVLSGSADRVPALAGLTTTGGRLNVARMLEGIDTIPPDPIVDLTVAQIESNRLTLRWTATGDDGRQGLASRYDVRFDLSPIDESTYATAIPAPQVALPQPAGSAEEVAISGLGFDTTYYVAVKAIDEYGNTSPISNIASGRTAGPPDIDVFPTTLTQSLPTGLSSDQTITVRNAATAGTLDFTVESAPPPPAAAAQPPIVLAKGEPDPRVGSPVADGGGGPDRFGYKWIDSDQPGGPVFTWVDIRAIGTPIAITGDEEISRFIPIGFTFPYYGSVFDFVRVCTNGYLSFTSGGIDFTNQPFPAPFSPDNMVAPFWEDLFFVPGSVAYTYGDETRFIVQWTEVELYGGGGPYTFQAILQRDGTIIYQYYSMGNPSSGATIGIQNGPPDDGLTVAFNHAYVHDRLAVRITAAPRWLTVSPLFGKLGPGQSMPVAVHFAAARLADGDYDGAVRIQSNDPDESSISIPTRLSVRGAPDITVGTGSLNFLNVFLGASETQPVLVTNDGVAPLHVAGVTAAPPGVFDVDAAPFTLNPGEYREVAVRFMPAALGPIVGLLTIQSDDPDEGIMTVVLSGTGVGAPRVSIEPTRLEAAALPGDQGRKSLRVRNAGTGTLQWSAAPESLLPPWVSIAPPSGSLPPGGDSALAVTLGARSLGAGEYGATVPFTTNDPAALRVDVEIFFHVGSIDAAAFEISPDPINRLRGGRWIEAFVELPQGYDPTLVVLSTVKLLRTVPCDDRSTQIGDFNRNNIPDLRLLFDRAAVLAALPDGKRVDIPIMGEIDDRTWFVGTRTVRVVPPRHPGKDPGGPRAFALHQNTPNPFNPATTIRFDLPAPASATLRVYGVDGRLAREWALGLLPAGGHQIEWDGRDSRGREVPSGVYFCRIQVEGGHRYDATVRMMLLK
ncbi:MAG TPA: S8 family serine peptidase [Candidatus Eisenbacteria bacterium]|nr:S8 family serine peptidase [Candidatus Eisenbacteria bacterium]